MSAMLYPVLADALFADAIRLFDGYPERVQAAARQIVGELSQAGRRGVVMNRKLCIRDHGRIGGRGRQRWIFDVVMERLKLGKRLVIVSQYKVGARSRAYGLIAGPS